MAPTEGALPENHRAFPGQGKARWLFFLLQREQVRSQLQPEAHIRVGQIKFGQFRCPRQPILQRLGVNAQMPGNGRAMKARLRPGQQRFQQNIAIALKLQPPKKRLQKRLMGVPISQ